MIFKTCEREKHDESDIEFSYSDIALISLRLVSSLFRKTSRWPYTSDLNTVAYRAFSGSDECKFS